ncbi:MAG: hypothetical protein CXZ00_10940 [Acidobacteria bacterium]|nr:MAG: hypothetical protein CXZ00_10940 [Acidobacteriota bacterium]
MFEEEIELERKEGSGFGPVLLILLMIGLFVGGIGFVYFQSRQTVKPGEATSVIENKLKMAGPVSVTFYTGNVRLSAMNSPNDPHYKLLQKAGIIKISKATGDFVRVDLTPAGKTLLATFPDIKGVPLQEKATAYTLPLATRKLVSVGTVTKLTQEKFRVQYTWSWQPTQAGELFDVSGKYVPGFSTYERAQLIDHYGANYYHGPTAQAAIVLFKGDKGWEEVRAY